MKLPYLSNPPKVIIVAFRNNRVRAIRVINQEFYEKHNLGQFNREEFPVLATHLAELGYQLTVAVGTEIVFPDFYDAYFYFKEPQK